MSTTAYAALGLIAYFVIMLPSILWVFQRWFRR